MLNFASQSSFAFAMLRLALLGKSGMLFSTPAYKKIARLLGAQEEVVSDLEKKMGKATGKKGVLEKIIQENSQKVKSSLEKLGLSEKEKAETIYQTFLHKVQEEDENLYKFFASPEFNTTKGCQVLVSKAQEIANSKEVFVLSKAKAEELLRANPPQNIIKLFGAKDIGELLQKEDLFEIFSGLRFAEDKLWLNNVFFKPYESLTASDFEKRPIDVRVLHEIWTEFTGKFITKKLHCISHLKELGVVFAIPFSGYFPGATLQVFSLVLHYLHEVGFYTRLFERYAKETSDKLGPRILNSLRGDVIAPSKVKKNVMIWQIVQRYLAKDDPRDPRLFTPHVNPETIHWDKAEENMKEMGISLRSLDLEFFGGMDFVGKYFKGENGRERLVSFDLVDNMVSLTNDVPIDTRYLYHRQEALWNKIFIEYLGKEDLERMIIQNMEKGYIELEL